MHINEGHAAFASIELIKDELERRAKIIDMPPEEGVKLRKESPETAITLGVSFDQAMKAVAAKIGFTSHTPVPAGNEEFEVEVFERYFGYYCDLYALDFDDLKNVTVHPSKVTGRDMANLSKLAMGLSTYANAVSKEHEGISRELYEIPEDDKDFFEFTALCFVDS